MCMDDAHSDDQNAVNVGTLSIPLFAHDVQGPTCCDENVVLLSAPSISDGKVINVYNVCAYGKCRCEYYLDGVKSQLLPCRFAYLLYGGFIPNPRVHDMVFEGICEGFKVVSSDVAPYECQNYSSILSSTSKPIMDALVEKELAEGFISISKSKPTCVHALGAVPKGPDSIRPITDCSRPVGVAVNDHSDFLARTFQYNTIHDVVALLVPGSHMSVIDIQSAYRAVPIYPPHRDFLGFKWQLGDEEQYFIDNRLCFGVKTGPYYFHSISCFVADVLRSCLDVLVVHYLDDYIVVSDTYDEALRGQLLTIKLLRYLGFHLAWKKITAPSRVAIYLGVKIDSNAMCLSLPVDKVEKFKAYVNKYRECDYISKKELEQLNGLLSHCSQIVQGGRLFTRRCFDMYKQVVRNGTRRIKISKGMHEDLKWWSEFAPYFNGLTCIPYSCHPTSIWTDSSLKGFGAVFGEQWLAGMWDDNQPGQLAHSSCNHFVPPPKLSNEDSVNINVLELWAVVVAMEHWASEFKNLAVKLYTDNQQVYHMLRNCSSINSQCMSWLRRLFWLCMCHNIKILPSYVRSEENVAADTLSRIPYYSDVVKFHDRLVKFNLCCFDSLKEFVGFRFGSIESRGDTVSSTIGSSIDKKATQDPVALL